MAAFRCTQKLRKRLGIGDPKEPPPPKNALGDWYGTILYTRNGHYLLFVSERSLLPVLLSARDLHSFERRFLQTLQDLLADLTVPRNRIEREISAMQPIFFGKTASRSVLGSLNEFVFMAKHWLEPGDLSIYDISLRLSETPCSPLETSFPDKETRQLLSNPHGFTVINGNGQ